MTCKPCHRDTETSPAPDSAAGTGRYALFDVDTRIPSRADRRLVFSPRVIQIEPQLRQLLDHGRRHAVPVVATTCLGVLRVLRRAQIAQEGRQPFPVVGSACPYAVPILDCLDEGASYVTVDGLSPPQQPLTGREIFLERRGCATPDENVRTRAYDVFVSNPNAAAVIRGLAIRRWAVFGLALEYCIMAAAEGLLKLGFDVAVLVDAVVRSARSSPQTVEATYRSLQQQGARLSTVRAFLDGKAWDD